MKLASILVFSEDPGQLKKFYEKVLKKSPEWVDAGYFGFDCGSTYLVIGPHKKVKGKSKSPERIMINFEVNDVKSEFERIKKDVKAKVVAEPYEMGGEDLLIATFEDPDGNYFQLMTPFDTDVPLKN